MDNTQKTKVTTGGTVVKRGKQNGYKNAVLHAKREAKFKAATVSKSRYQGLSVEERIKLVKSRRGESKREMARLQKLLAEQPATVKPMETKPVVKKTRVKVGSKTS